MTAIEFEKWKVEFRKQFMRPDEDCSFLDRWFTSKNDEGTAIDQFSLAWALDAISTVCADQRIVDRQHPAAFVRNRLPLILEILGQRRRREKELEETRQRRAEYEAARKKA